ncbi:MULTISPECIES: phage terminase large subunit family protein [Photorhabdus]|uniref:Terminase n=1 Tax=Photorhabdus kayaii TaxID=230088 RepID=A0ABX0B3J2_9GAMM|nr:MULTISPECIES: terminase family protein [Photorhabdus]MCC8374028.1 terminase family protein [Photorhabdus bodei]MCT8350367.1 terminase family protein [Photorhabdus kayaii]MDB6367270.1 terminase family protein [Photorhabdus bodei]NDL14126.1 terminase [Photorhabdus kayaii]NDL27646.1 terminase [Photorhabdus kayaii]
MSAAIQLYKYQRTWFLDRSRFKIGKFARQTGKTFTTTLELTDDCFEVEATGGRTRWVILSRGERQAREAIEEGVKKHCQAYNMVAREIEGYFKGASGERYTMLEAELPGGSRITALPANPDTARGFASNVFLDEFAFHLDSRKIWTALFPVISNGYNLRVTSTPNGKGNKFYELMTDKSLEQIWSRHIVDIHKAVQDGLPRNIQEMRTALNDEDAWAQEFELKWLDEASAWLSYELIDGVENDLAGLPEHYLGGPCFVGVDIGIRNDLFVIWVLEQVGDVYWTREIMTRKRATFAEQDALLDDVFFRYRVLRCCMDQTGMGEKPVEDAKRRHGNSRVEGVIFTSNNKLTLATRGKEVFEDKQIRIPRGDQPLRADLHKLQKILGPTGAPRFVADSDTAGHADRAWAGFLAVNASDGPSGPVTISSRRQRLSAQLLGGY